MKLFKKLLIATPIILIISYTVSINTYTFSSDGKDIEIDYYIVPEIKESSLKKIQDATKEIWESWQHVMETYRAKAKELTTAEQINSGIMNRDTIMNYLVFVIKFLSQLWLVVWAGFIMYAGYKYMLSVFNANRTSPDMIKNAIIWVIIVVFSYAIMKTLTSLVWLS